MWRDWRPPVRGCLVAREPKGCFGRSYWLRASVPIFESQAQCLSLTDPKKTGAHLGQSEEGAQSPRCDAAGESLIEASAAARGLSAISCQAIRRSPLGRQGSSSSARSMPRATSMCPDHSDPCVSSCGHSTGTNLQRKVCPQERLLMRIVATVVAKDEFVSLRRSEFAC